MSGIETPAVRRLLARALAGDGDALVELAALPEAPELVRAARIGPALALGAPAGSGRGGARPLQAVAMLAKLIGDPRTVVREAAAHRLLLDRALARAGEALGSADTALGSPDTALGARDTALGAAGVAWAPLKGLDLGSRVYPAPEARPTGDLDLLIAPTDLPAARAALAVAGWRPRRSGRHYEAYLAGEAYNWQALDASGLLLELHYRLWGVVPAGLAAELLAAATPDPTLGPTARRLSLAGAYVIAAVHAWASPPPRPLLAWWDLERIAAAGGPGLAAEVTALAAAHGLELFVLLAAEVAGDLWPRPEQAAIVAALAPRLRRAERLARRRAQRRDLAEAPFEPLVLARLLSGRPSRSGWRALGRRLWAHPGAVEEETPPHWRWPARRLVHLARSFRCGTIANALSRRFERRYGPGYPTRWAPPTKSVPTPRRTRAGGSTPEGDPLITQRRHRSRAGGGAPLPP